MINRDNWFAVRAYLKYRREVDLLSQSSQRLEDTWLTHVLEWADSSSFVKVAEIRSAYPQYLRSFDFAPASVCSAFLSLAFSSSAGLLRSFGCVVGHSYSWGLWCYK